MSILGEKVFVVVGLEEEGGGRLVLVLVLELVFLVISISMAYICIGICLSSST